MRFAPAVCLCAIFCSGVAMGAGQAKPKATGKPAAKAAAKPKTSKKALDLGVLTTGVNYDKPIKGNYGGVLDLQSGYTCTSDKPLPTGLTIDCKTIPTLTGQTSETGAVDRKVVIKDDDGNSVELDIHFVLSAPNSPVDIGGAGPPPAAPGPLPEPTDFTKEEFMPPPPIAEGAQEIKGQLTPSLGADATSYEVQVLAQPDNGAPAYFVPLKPASAGGAASTQAALGSGGTYDLNFAAPLPPGIHAQLQVLDKKGTVVKYGAVVALPLTIDMPAGARLVVQSEIEATTSSIQGHVDMPAIKVAPTTTPVTQGNYPSIRVSVWDPDQNQWFVAPLVSGSDATKTATSVPVGDNGDFAVTLKTPLTSGEKVQIDAIPPEGRTFTGALPGPGQGLSVTRVVHSNLAVTQPTISSALTEGTTTMTGSATKGVSVAFRVLGPKLEGAPDPDEGENYCLTSDEMQTKRPGKERPTWLAVKNSTSSALSAPVDSSSGTFNATLVEALKEGDRIRVVQIFPADTDIAGPQRKKCASAVYEVRYSFDWHRTNVAFVSGILISNSSSGSSTNANFSQANLFLALIVDHAWRLPGADCLPEVNANQTMIEGSPKFSPSNNRKYRVDGAEWGRPGHYCNAYAKLDEDSNSGRRVATSGWRANGHGTPGVSSFFEGRLSAIPVSSTTASSTSTSTTATGTTGTTGTATSTSGTSSFLTSSQKVFRVSTGLYFPWVVTHGKGDHPSGLFIGPLAKAGFDTITGAGSTSTTAILGTTQTVYFQSAYNNYSFGARLGNMDLSSSSSRAPLIDHYLDITIGRFSNLQTYVCHRVSTMHPATNVPGSSCASDYPQYFPGGVGVSDSRKTLYRLNFEGLIRVVTPSSLLPLYIGFNANIAQHTVGAENLDHGYAPPDDIRILFGTKIDMGSLLSKLNLGGS